MVDIENPKYKIGDVLVDIENPKYKIGDVLVAVTGRNDSYARFNYKAGSCWKVASFRESVFYHLGKHHGYVYDLVLCSKGGKTFKRDLSIDQSFVENDANFKKL